MNLKYDGCQRGAVRRRRYLGRLESGGNVTKYCGGNERAPTTGSMETLTLDGFILERP